MQTTFVAALPGTTFGASRRPAGRAQSALRLSQQQMPRGLVAAQALGGAVGRLGGTPRHSCVSQDQSSRPEQSGCAPSTLWRVLFF